MKASEQKAQTDAEENLVDLLNELRQLSDHSESGPEVLVPRFEQLMALFRKHENWNLLKSLGKKYRERIPVAYASPEATMAWVWMALANNVSREDGPEDILEIAAGKILHYWPDKMPEKVISLASASILKQADYLEEAKSLLQQAAEYLEAEGRYPAAAKALFRLGEIWIREEEKEEAILWWKKAMAIVGEHADLDQVGNATGDEDWHWNTLAQWFSTLAMHQYYQGQMADAADNYKQTLKLCQRHHDYWGSAKMQMYLATVYTSMGRHEEALAVAEEAIDYYQKPCEVDLLLIRAKENKAIILEHAGRFEEALEIQDEIRAWFFDPAQEQNSQSKSFKDWREIALVNRLYLLIYMRRLELAEKGLAELALVTDKTIENDYGHFLQAKGRLLQSNGDYETALSLYQQAMDLFIANKDIPGQLQNMGYQGDCLIRMGREAEGRAIIRQCLEKARRLGMGNIISRVERILPF